MKKNTSNDLYDQMFKLNCFVLIFIIGLFTYITYRDYQICINGKETFAVVKTFEHISTRKGYKNYYHKIEYDGNITLLDLFQQYEPGAKLYVTYLPTKPDEVKIGRWKNSFRKLMSEDIGIKGVFVLFWFIATTVYLIYQLKNRRVISKEDTLKSPPAGHLKLTKKPNEILSDDVIRNYKKYL